MRLSRLYKKLLLQVSTFAIKYFNIPYSFSLVFFIQNCYYYSDNVTRNILNNMVKDHDKPLLESKAREEKQMQEEFEVFYGYLISILPLQTILRLELHLFMNQEGVFFLTILERYKRILHFIINSYK